MEGNSIISPAPSVGNPGKTKGRWSSLERSSMETFYPTKDNEWLARYLGRTVSSVRTKAHHMGLRKSAEYRAEIGRRNVSVRHS